MFDHRPLALLLGLGLCGAVAAPAMAQHTASWRPASPATHQYDSSVQPAADQRYTEAAPRQGAPSGQAAPAPNDGGQGITPIEGGANRRNTTPIQGGAPTRARVSKGEGTLPRDQGQVWREYDIRPYTARAQGVAKPEQAIVDWVLRETGYEAWHSDPLGILSANRDTLRVYHTPEMQRVVADIVDRFVNQSAESEAFSLRVATVRNPNWRVKALPLMNAIPVQSPGVQGWIMPKENAAMLLAELTRRSDYREYNSPQQLVGNGQSIVISTMRPRSYIKGVITTGNVWPGFQPEHGQLEEGFSLEFSPLLTLDRSAADAVIKLRLHQVEKMVKVKLDIPTPVAPNQRMEVEVPQVTMANLHERFRWPTGQVLLLSMGVVGTPGGSSGNALTSAIPMLNDPPRADALLIVESRGSVLPPSAPNTPGATASRNPATFEGRY